MGKYDEVRHAFEVLDAAHKATTEATTAGELSRARAIVRNARGGVLHAWIDAHEGDRDAAELIACPVGIDIARLIVNPKKVDIKP